MFPNPDKITLLLSPAVFEQVAQSSNSFIMGQSALCTMQSGRKMQRSLLLLILNFDCWSTFTLRMLFWIVASVCVWCWCSPKIFGVVIVRVKSQSLLVFTGVSVCGQRPGYDACAAALCTPLDDSSPRSCTRAVGTRVNSLECEVAGIVLSIELAL